MTASHSGRDSPHAHLETTKQVRGPHIIPANESSRHRVDSSDNSEFDSRNESGFVSEFDAGDAAGHREESHDDIVEAFANGERQQLFETRQCFVDRRVETPTCHDSVDSFIERARSQGSATSSGEFEPFSRDHNTRFFEERLPDAILKLDRRQAIPAPRHKNDVLLEIEASTVDRRDLMIRPGVRCAESLPQGVETTGMDCIGRVVQVTTHARAIYGISIDDRVAAIYPFNYKDECKDKGRRNKRYALVDAGLVVAVPKHVDAADAAIMIRLYMSAFQSIRLGLGSFHDRYDSNQLKGQSILVQNGVTELGQALIDLARQLGASQIFATGPTEHHPLLMELGAIPLGSETFSWELFIEENLSLALVQEMPTTENFEQFISVLDDSGHMVYIQPDGHHDDDGDLGITPDDVSCDGLHFRELAEKAKEFALSAKFSIILSCSPQYIVYEGVWQSCKQNQSQFKEDLRYLFGMLGQGNLKPNFDECIGPEEVADVQDRIELLGKKGNIVCLPTALYEKKAELINQEMFTPCNKRLCVIPENSPKRDHQGFPLVERDVNSLSHHDDPAHTYALQAGYAKAASAYESLSDFNCMHNTKKSSRASSDIMSLPVLPETSASYPPRSSLNHQAKFGSHQHSSPLGSMGSSKRHSDDWYQNETSSLISSVGQSSAANASTSQTAFSDSALKRVGAPMGVDPPRSIQFRSHKQSRRYRAFQRQRRAKERWKRSMHQKKKVEEVQVVTVTHPSEDTTDSITYSPKQLRREARMRGQKYVPGRGVCEEEPVKIDERIGSERNQTGGMDAAAQNEPVSNVTSDMMGEQNCKTAVNEAGKALAQGEFILQKEDSMEHAVVRKPDPPANNCETNYNIDKKGGQTKQLDKADEGNVMKAVEDQARVSTAKTARAASESLSHRNGPIIDAAGKAYSIAMERDQMNKRQFTKTLPDATTCVKAAAGVRKGGKDLEEATHTVVAGPLPASSSMNATQNRATIAPIAKKRPDERNYNQFKPHSVELQDSRNEVESRENSSDLYSFTSLMSKWKNNDNVNRQAMSGQTN